MIFLAFFFLRKLPIPCIKSVIIPSYEQIIFPVSRKNLLFRIYSTIKPVMLFLSNEKALVLNAVYRSQISTLFKPVAKLESAYGKCALKHTSGAGPLLKSLSCGEFHRLTALHLCRESDSTETDDIYTNLINLTFLVNHIASHSCSLAFTARSRKLAKSKK